MNELAAVAEFKYRRGGWLVFGILLIVLGVFVADAPARPLWQFGRADHNTAEFALAPDGYSFFGEDGLFAVGLSDPRRDWPYVHPGPADAWAGSRPHTFTLLFGVQAAVTDGVCRLVVDVADTHAVLPPRLRIDVNGRTFDRSLAPGGGDASIHGQPAQGRPQQVAVEFPAALLRAGRNQIALTTTAGSWLLYDALALDTPAAVAAAPLSPAVVIAAATAPRALIERGGRLYQPVAVTVRNPGAPVDALLQGERVRLAGGTQTLEALAPAADEERELTVSLEVGGQTLASPPVRAPAARKWTVYILMHSHVDIGYTDLQPTIAAKQAHNLTRALELIRATRDYPAGARFKWNTEVFWPVEQFYRTATPAQQAEFEQAVRDGNIGIDAMYANLLTGVCRGEELLRQFSFAAAFGRRCGVAVDAMMISDVPGLTWGVVPAAAHNGVKYISDGPNGGDRVGWAGVTWEDKPFWWVGPDGRSRVLYWAPYQGYSYAHAMSNVPKAAARLLDRLAADRYPYDLVQLRWSKGDNGSADERVMEQVRDWNARYAWPKLVIATTSEMFHEFERRYGSQLPTFRGDFTPYWEDGVGSAARETAMNRHSADRLLQTETLWAMLAPDKYPAADFDAAWKNVILWSEHTWGAHCSVSQPDSEFTKAQWKIKQAFALDADRQSRDLLARALAQRKGAPVTNAVDVFNTTAQFIPWARARVPQELSWPTDHYGPTSQRLHSQDVVVEYCCPPQSLSRFFSEKRKPEPADEGARAEGATLTTPEVALRVDTTTGNIVSLRLLEGNIELVDTNSATGLNAYSYLVGGDLKALRHNGPVKISVKERGPLVASLLIESDAPGCRKLTREVRLHAHRNYVEIINTLDKLPVREKEGVHFGFAFNVPGGVMRINSPWASVEPEKDQIPGACKNWFCVERGVDLLNKGKGVTWVTLDAPLVEVGGITANLPATQPDPAAYLKQIGPSQTLHSWAMNNHWHTNYKADQEGPVTFRYFIFPRGRFPEPPQLDLEQSQPLIAASAVGPQRSLDQPAVVHSAGRGTLTALKPTADGKAWIVRLFGASGQDEIVALRWAEPKPPRVTYSDVSERPGHPAPAEIPVPAWGIVTLRAERPGNGG